ncbi:alkane 1-monooxygenase [Salinisphaera sp. P385]|uniref:Alkane 1-monooxygenase n=1 Tax=Spectribacter acetivorans TaxID=3075603 RepID=A0ABU3B3V2_9GAMM|nr:alkane 1-monooxygenase [Salinisphaera sp. P385]MDT0617139.1 alkane 1-monooxygenase [Salinisphaera sp. P385]
MSVTTAELARAHDSKRYLWLWGAVVAFLPMIGGALAWLTGSSWAWFFAPAFLYGLVPLADWLVGDDDSNADDSVLRQLEDDPYYRWCTYLFIPVQYVVVVWAAWLVGSGSLDWVALTGLTWSLAILSGVGINTAHELGHKKPAGEKWLAKIALAPVAYGHFFVEHNKGHHRRVATPEDPASSRMGESFYRFLPRTVIGSLTSAWEIEKQRLARCGKSVWSFENENLQAWSMTVVLFGGLALLFGWVVLPFLLIQAAIGASLLEAVNYLEHYGLKRRQGDDGRYERCKPEHSWNNNHIVTNVLLYHLQRHSDHHANPTRRFQALRHFDDAPQLPTGYAGMIVLAYIPWLWYRVMDPKVVAHYDGDLDRANLQPGREAALKARYAAA